MVPRKLATSQPAPAAENIRKGWWKIENLAGAREKVLAAVDAMAEVPDWGKSANKAAIAARPAEFNLFHVDAHFHCGIHAGSDNATLHLTIQGEKAIL